MEKNKFVESYARESDEALLLLALDADGLVAEANDALMAEIQKRGLHLQDFKKKYVDQQSRTQLEKSLSKKRILCWVAGAACAVFLLGALKAAIGLRLGGFPYMGIVGGAGYLFQHLFCKND